MEHDMVLTVFDVPPARFWQPRLWFVRVETPSGKSRAAFGPFGSEEEATTMAHAVAEDLRKAIAVVAVVTAPGGSA
jgi:hypothetical protein